MAFKGDLSTIGLADLFQTLTMSQGRHAHSSGWRKS